MEKRYNSLNMALREEFGQKIMKVSLDGGFTCPNRDGTLGTRGCIFCGEEGAGEFAASRWLPIKDQIEEQKEFLARKWDGSKYIAYFQNFTNTYGSIHRLKEVYEEALEAPGLVGLAIATRPDCINDQVLDLLSHINERTYLWLELGLQTIHDKSARLIRRAYPLETYLDIVEKLRARNIRLVTHVILGLPGEEREEILETVKLVGRSKSWGIKLHSLYIQRDTDLYDYYLKNPFKLMTREEYISLVVDCLEILPKEMVIHRLTGDGKRDLLHEPKWSLDKLRVLTGIDMEMRRRDSYQGKKII